MFCVTIIDARFFENSFYGLACLFGAPDIRRTETTAGVVGNIIIDEVRNDSYNICCTFLIDPTAISAFSDVIVGLCQKITDRLLGQHHTSLTLHDQKKES